jgi:transcriptional regulator with XRE-family HTH domain
MTSKGAKMLKKWREAGGLDQSSAAKKLGTTRVEVSRLENGHRPGLKRALKLLQVCNIPIEAWS